MGKILDFGSTTSTKYWKKEGRGRRKALGIHTLSAEEIISHSVRTGRVVWHAQKYLSISTPHTKQKSAEPPPFNLLVQCSGHWRCTELSQHPQDGPCSTILSGIRNIWWLIFQTSNVFLACNVLFFLQDFAMLFGDFLTFFLCLSIPEGNTHIWELSDKKGSWDARGTPSPCTEEQEDLAKSHLT